MKVRRLCIVYIHNFVYYFSCLNIKNMSLAHPVLREMLNSGCTSQNNIILAFQTYIELCEAHNFKNVNYEFSSELDMVYLKAIQDIDEELFVPVSVKDDITPNWIEIIKQNICQNYKGFNLVVRDGDTTCATYKISTGLIAPLSPESSKKKKMEDEKKKFVQTEIKKMLPELYSKAEIIN